MNCTVCEKIFYYPFLYVAAHFQRWLQQKVALHISFSAIFFGVFLRSQINIYISIYIFLFNKKYIILDMNIFILFDRKCCHTLTRKLITVAYFMLSFRNSAKSNIFNLLLLIVTILLLYTFKDLGRGRWKMSGRIMLSSFFLKWKSLLIFSSSFFTFLKLIPNFDFDYDKNVFSVFTNSFWFFLFLCTGELKWKIFFLFDF